MTTKENKELIRLFSSAVMCLAISRKSRPTSYVTGTSEARYHKFQIPSTSSFFLTSFYCWEWLLSFIW